MQVNQTSALRGASSGAVEGIKSGPFAQPAVVGGSPAIAAQAAARPAAGGQPPLLTKLADWPDGRHERVADAQQTLGYLDRLSAGLSRLRYILSSQLARPNSVVTDKRADREIQQVSAVLKERSASTAGRLDAQLRYDDAPQVRQAFKVKGLDLESLKKGDREVLSFAVSGSQEVGSVVVDPQISDAALLRRLNVAFAPLGIRVERGAQDDIVLSVARQDWVSVRDSLAVRGGGQRFPAGQFARVRAEPAPPDALRPESWSADTPQAVRRSLVEVVGALARLDEAKDAAEGVLARQVPDPSREEAERVWAEAAAASFVQQTQRPGYEVYAQVAPAVLGVTRSRVESLLTA